jgi:hypothetical protein
MHVGVRYRALRGFPMHKYEQANSHTKVIRKSVVKKIVVVNQKVNYYGLHGMSCIARLVEWLTP